MVKRFVLGDYSNRLQELHFDNDFVLVEQKNAAELCCLLNRFHEENNHLKSLIKALKKSNADYIYQIKKAYDEDLLIKELADNCGVDLE